MGTCVIIPNTTSYKGICNNTYQSCALTHNPASAMPHSSVYQVITILKGSDHSLCLCGKLRIKHASASGRHRGLSKGQFVSFNCCLSACLLNGIKLCRSFAFLKSCSVLHKNRVDVITTGHGLVQNNGKAGSKETRIQFFPKCLQLDIILYVSVCVSPYRSDISVHSSNNTESKYKILAITKYCHKGSLTYCKWATLWTENTKNTVACSIIFIGWLCLTIKKTLALNCSLAVCKCKQRKTGERCIKPEKNLKCLRSICQGL